MKKDDNKDGLGGVVFWINKRNGKTYRVISDKIINATNLKESEIGVLYEVEGDSETKLFYREVSEFRIKFKPRDEESN